MTGSNCRFGYYLSLESFIFSLSYYLGRGYSSNKDWGPAVCAPL